jgi:hypothetical protein
VVIPWTVSAVYTAEGSAFHRFVVSPVIALIAVWYCVDSIHVARHGKSAYVPFLLFLQTRGILADYTVGLLKKNRSLVKRLAVAYSSPAALNRGRMILVWKENLIAGLLWWVGFQVHLLTGNHFVLLVDALLIFLFA